MFVPGIGIDNFKKMIESNVTYIDKTKFIQDIVAPDHPEVFLFTRPRRFGKTLYLSMLAEFFDICKNSKNLFANLYIAHNHELCDKWLNQYPVINITLKEINTSNYKDSIDNFSECIRQIIIEHLYLLNSPKIINASKKILNKYLDCEGSEFELRKSLIMLSEALYLHWEKSIILLIDEYDVPLNYAWQYNYYSEMLSFIRNLFGYALKGNKYLKFAILTGCLRISKESIFTGVNNFKCFPISNFNYAETFGFTAKEVDYLLEISGFSHKRHEIKAWYDGYTFGNNSEMYCPWDVLNYLYDLKSQPNLQPQAYWLNSSSNDLIKNVDYNITFDIKDKIQILLSKGSIRCQISEGMTYEAILNSENDFWNLLYATGYLTKSRHFLNHNDIQSDETDVWLQIPNAEIERIFISLVDRWFKTKIENLERKELLQAFWSGDDQKLTAIISNILLNTISYYDYNQYFYHAFLLGLFYGLKYSVISNVESGEGRVDIIIKDSEINPQVGACIEVKTTQDESINLDKLSQYALKQIQDNQYDAPLQKLKLKVINWGIAFYKKSCIARSSY
ncbi:MAG: AAA family ATPase [Desulfovibrionaceae bacterium]|nr:AAA family ATPase [Desulfovibrionaceae bacterium]